MTNTTTTNAKFETLLKKNAALLAKTSRELAMNFDVPARCTVGIACAEMGISEKTWQSLMSYQIAKEEAAAGAAWLTSQAVSV